jgi:hypothetical protein
VIGSQAYAREFENAEPDPNDPASREMVWLSRGLYEALQRMIGQAKNERFALRAALYESTPATSSASSPRRERAIRTRAI